MMTTSTSQKGPASLFIAGALVLMLTSHTQMTAQQNIKPFLCGNEIFSDMVRTHHPELHEAFNKTFDEALHATHSRNNEPLTIRVVVHVIWNAPEENLHDSIILDQIRILNADYNKLNADTGNLRPIFKPVAASADIEFALESIVRIQTNALFEVDILGGNLLPEVKQTSLGGSDAWDPELYLNLWICKIQPIEILGIPIGQILGFSFPPNNLPHWPENVGAPTPGEDGVVVDYRVVGSNNPNIMENPVDGSPLDIRGRTPVHEVGHYLGLRHIWGDGNTFGPNDCNQSDGIDDTPYANAQSEFDCDLNRNTCDVIEDHYSADVPDLIENYMDYSNETCMNMFSQGQVELMRNVLMGPRSGLIMPFSSTKETDELVKFSVAPNPANEALTVYLSSQETKPLAVRLLSFSGQIMYQDTDLQKGPGSREIRIDVQHLTPGIYVVELLHQQGTAAEKVVIR